MCPELQVTATNTSDKRQMPAKETTPFHKESHKTALLQGQVAQSPVAHEKENIQAWQLGAFFWF